jgi:DNA polymerase-3 subunit beta
MKAICTTENLKRGILIAEKIIGKNLTLPILSNILLDAEKGGLKVYATNLEIGLVAKIRAKIDESGKIAVPGRIVGGILAQLGDDNKITLDEKNQTLRMIYSGNSAMIKGMDAKDFPIIPKPESKALFSFSAAELQKKAGNILIASAVSDTRQELTGIFFEFSENKITMAATDSFRLAEASIKLDKAKITEDYKKYLTKSNSIIVPARTISEVVRAISAEDENIQVYLSESQIFFETADVMFVSRLIDGKYPEYKQVIPKEFSMNVFLEKEDFLKAARLAGVFSDSKSREVRIKIEGGKNKMSVFAQSVEAGEGSWNVDCHSDAKADIEVAFNNRYLLDGLNSLQSDTIAISLNDSFGPVMLRELSGDKPKTDYFHIIMPIRS